MKLLLLYLGLMLIRAHGPVVRSNFDASKFSGKWYSVLLASEQMEKIEENGSMRVFVEEIQAFGKNLLGFKYRTIVNEECNEIFSIANKIKDGIYTVQYDGYNIFHVVETIYDEYMILYVKNYNRGNTFQLLELYGKTPDLSPKLKEKFVDICEKHGVVQENILDLTQVDRCLYAQSRQENFFSSQGNST